MLFLIRYPEIGKEPRPEKSKLRRDLVEVLLATLDEPRIEVDVGRILLDVPRDATEILARVHGTSSFSPCVRVTLDDLPASVVDFARGVLAGKRSFAVKVKRVGSHAFTSQTKAAELGSAIALGIPGVSVNLTAPDETIHVEIRGDVAYLFNIVIPGVEPHAPREPLKARRFLVDAMLGTLATRMRSLGFDAVFCNDTADSFLLRKSEAEGRILLTQDKELSRLGGDSAYFVSARTLPEQLAEILHRFDLEVSDDSIFTRCSRCNAELEPIPKERIVGRVPDRVARSYEEFYTCPGCGKLYWKGSHFDQIIASIPSGARRVD